MDKFEGMMEFLVEGSVGRVFGSKITLADMEKRLERVVEANRQIAVKKTFVPNRFEIYLNVADLAELCKIVPKSRAEESLTAHLMSYARQRNFEFNEGRAYVWLSDDDELSRRKIIIKAFTVDSRQAKPAQPVTPAKSNSAASADSGSFTRVLPQGSINNRQAGSVVERPAALLIAPEMAENNPAKYIRFSQDILIGRGLDNDIVYNDDDRLSRRHAKIEFKYGQFVLGDLGSTNGTLLNGREISETVLASGDTISFGGLEVQFWLEN